MAGTPIAQSHIDTLWNVILTAPNLQDGQKGHAASLLNALAVALFPTVAPPRSGYVANVG